MKVTLSQIFVHGKKKRWCVSWHPAGEPRKRRYFKSKTEAESEAESVRLDLQLAGKVWTAQERSEVIAVWSEIASKGLTLRDVWESYKLGGTARATGQKPLRVVIDELIVAKRAANRRESYTTHLKMFLNGFAKGRDMTPIGAVTTAAVESWIASRGYKKPSAMSTAKVRISTLFSFAVKRRYVASNPCDAIEAVSEDEKAPVILSTHKAARCLVWTAKREPAYLAWLSLALLAGLRPEEADKIEWGDIDIERGTVRVDAEDTKVRCRRIVHPLPSAVAWLKSAQALGARLPLPKSTRRRFQRRLRDRLWLAEWPHDVLRHTAASMWLAQIGDAGKVANELGNSERILKRHYRELVSREDAAKFWAMAPERLRSLRNSVANGSKAAHRDQSHVVDTNAN